MNQNTAQTHTTRVSVKHGRYLVICDVCNVVGRPDGEDYEVDAEAIAQRHQDVAGFESLS